MTTAHLKFIALAVGALLLVWAATALLPSGTDRPTADFRLTPVTADSVDTITVTAPAETATIARRATGGWSVNGFEASSTAVAELFAALRDTVRPELVSRSTASFARLGLDSDTARRLMIRSRGRPLLDVLVSARGPEGNWDGAYVRRPSDSAVYSWPNRLGLLARRRADDWRDRVIAAVVPDSVRRVEVERGARRYSLQRRDGAWTFSGSGSGPADSGRVASLLDRFRTLNASSVWRCSGPRRASRLGRRLLMSANAAAKSPLLAFVCARLRRNSSVSGLSGP